MDGAKLRTVTVETTAEVQVSPELMGKWFASMTDDDQAQFFEFVGIEFAKFNSRGLQESYIARHMFDCEGGCVTDAGRGFLRELAEHFLHYDRERP